MNGQKNKPSFLYVEDDPLCRQVMDFLMNRVLEYPLTIFEHSENFMERVRALPQKPRVIFLDVEIRPHNGYIMIKMLREDDDYKTATVVAVTASVRLADVEAMKKSGFDGLIAKPIRNRLFPDLLRRILEGESIWSTA